MSTKDGGPAFPVADYDHMVFEPKTVAETKRDLSGMSLRDYFASKAMAAVIMNPETQRELASIGRDEGMVVISKVAYMQADAMLAARSQP